MTIKKEPSGKKIQVNRVFTITLSFEMSTDEHLEIKGIYLNPDNPFLQEKAEQLEKLFLG